MTPFVGFEVEAYISRNDLKKYINKDTHYYFTDDDTLDDEYNAKIERNYTPKEIVVNYFPLNKRTDLNKKLKFLDTLDLLPHPKGSVHMHLSCAPKLKHIDYLRILIAWKFVLESQYPRLNEYNDLWQDVSLRDFRDIFILWSDMRLANFNKIRDYEVCRQMSLNLFSLYKYGTLEFRCWDSLVSSQDIIDEVNKLLDVILDTERLNNIIRNDKKAMKFASKYLPINL